MKVRNYNIYFHTHTVSGIIVSVLLFVIFFAGSFAFFKNEIASWQQQTPLQKNIKLPVNYLTDSLEKAGALKESNLAFYFREHSNDLNVSISKVEGKGGKGKGKPEANARKGKDGKKKKGKRGGRGEFFGYNTANGKIKDYEADYDLGEFLYRLHFFAPLNGVVSLGFPFGYYVAGIVAIFFLFALITGLLLHWDKIVSNFFLFRPKEKLKTLWTDLHTALGVVSYPFLLIFSITGAYFLVTTVLFMPGVLMLSYKGNQDKLMKDIGREELKYDFAGKPLTTKVNLESYIAMAKHSWGQDVEIRSLETKSYGDSNMHVIVNGAVPNKQRFASEGQMIMRVRDQKIIKNISPAKSASFVAATDNIMYKLHFGNFGGYLTKVMYFLFGISGCLVIISGVLIWFKARDKKHIEPAKRKFNEWLTRIYLGICLSMLPVTAAAFIAVKLQPSGGQSFIYSFYFWSWLMVAILFTCIKNRNTLSVICFFSTAFIGISIPLLNGWIGGQWIWKSIAMQHNDILAVDLLWLSISFFCAYCGIKTIKKNRTAALSQHANLKNTKLQTAKVESV